MHYHSEFCSDGKMCPLRYFFMLLSAATLCAASSAAVHPRGLPTINRGDGFLLKASRRATSKLKHRLSPSTSAYARHPRNPQPDLPIKQCDSSACDGLGAEQVHLQVGHNHSSVIVTWTTTSGADPSVPCGVSYRAETAGDTRAKFSECYVTAPAAISGSLQRVRASVLTDLQPATRYVFSIQQSAFSGSFKTTPSPGSPIAFGVVGDVGQTENSHQTLIHLAALKDGLDMVLHAGDISYADGLEARWDSYGRLSEFLFSALPAIYTAGNHEIETNWEQYEGRFPQDHHASGSDSPLWFSANHGMAHIVVLQKYDSFGPGSPQMEWLVKDLASVDRSLTPWVIALCHVPWYNSNLVHRGEGELHRQTVEEVLYDAGVDLFVAGHVHSYERFHSTFANIAHPCGITYLNIGDGGNREGLAGPWDDVQPQNSAFRESSYGSAVLSLLTPTEAQWEWHRNQDGVHVVADSVMIERNVACVNRSPKEGPRQLHGPQAWQPFAFW